ncbi:uncharacterized protein LOC121386797 [Gigantopelta aegis]|uniref:uncharacterized protein LOC121386797 n=1 Tax=Gigantopelta aegis TaxID=1735272 RepID=UPI001B88BBDA|nr:uncharacterized protein LOC121386797 [Gigantopelta aegis]
MVKNHFNVLGIQPGASEDEVKKSFRSLAKKWHPDKNSAAGAEDKFKEIVGSYEYLLSKDRREILARDLTRPKEEKNPTADTKKYTSSFSFAQTFGTSYSGGKTAPKNGEKKKFSSKTQDSQWSKFFGKDKPKQKKTEQTKWSQPSTEYDHDDTFSQPSTSGTNKKEPKPNYSNAFRSFVDHLDNEFDTLFGSRDSFSTFFDGPDAFTAFFGEAPYPEQKSKFKSKPKAKAAPRNVAPERGATDGLDEEYLFSPRSPGKPRKPKSPFRFSMDFDEEERMKSGYKERCIYCGKPFPLHKLSAHEARCGKFPDSSSEDEMSYSSDEGYGQSKHPGDWRAAHRDLLNKIRKDKEAARRRESYEKDAVIQCPTCGRSFSKLAAERHIPFCLERSKRKDPAWNSPGRSTTNDEYTKFQRSQQTARNGFKPPENSKTSDDTVRGSSDRARQNKESWSREKSNPTKHVPGSSQTSKPAEDKPSTSKNADDASFGIHGLGSSPIRKARVAQIVRGSLVKMPNSRAVVEQKK